MLLIMQTIDTNYHATARRFKHHFTKKKRENDLLDSSIHEAACALDSKTASILNKKNTYIQKTAKKTP